MNAKKAKLMDIGRSFQEVWMKLFVAIECNRKALCFLCDDSVVCHTSNVKQHFESNHKNIAELGEMKKGEYLPSKLRKYHSQCLNFTKFNSKSNHLAIASFRFLLCIAKHGESLSDGDFIKTAMLTGRDSLYYFLNIKFCNKSLKYHLAEILQRIKCK